MRETANTRPSHASASAAIELVGAYVRKHGYAPDDNTLNDLVLLAEKTRRAAFHARSLTNDELLSGTANVVAITQDEPKRRSPGV